MPESYQKRVWGRAWSVTINVFGSTWQARARLLLLPVAAAILAVLAGSGGATAEQAYRGVELAGASLFVVFVLFLVFNRLRAPRLLDLDRQQEIDELKLQVDASKASATIAPRPLHFEVRPRSSISVSSSGRHPDKMDNHSLVIFLELMIDNIDNRPLTLRRIDFEVLEKGTQLPDPDARLGPERPTHFSRTFESSTANDSIPVFDERGLEIAPGPEGRGRFYASASRRISEAVIAKLSQSKSHFLRVRFSAMGQSDTTVDFEPVKWPTVRGSRRELRRLSD